MTVKVKIVATDYLLKLFDPDIVGKWIFTGWKFEFGVYNVMITAPKADEGYNVQCPVSPDTVLSGKASPANLTLLRHKLLVGMSKANSYANTSIAEKMKVDVSLGSALQPVLGGITPVPGGVGPMTIATLQAAELVLTGWSLYDAKNWVDSMLGIAADANFTTAELQEAEKSLKAQYQAEKVGKLKKLAEATHIGQPVQGTDPNSTYYVIALNGTVKMAARMLNGQASIRVEGHLSENEQQQFTDMGFSHQKEGHWSTHFDLGAVPVARVVGAVLMGVDTNWVYKVDNADSLKKALHL